MTLLKKSQQNLGSLTKEKLRQDWYLEQLNIWNFVSS